MEPKPINEILPESDIQVESCPVSDVLTEAQKEAAIRHAIILAMERYTFSMREKGLNTSQIESRIAAVNWEEMIDKKQVIESANRRMLWHLETERENTQIKEQEKDQREQLIRLWDAAYFYRCIKKYFLTLTGQFDFDTSNEQFIKAVCFFFSGDPRFVTELGYSFTKGLLILGSAGLGKTKTFEAISNNPIQPIRIYSMIDISRQVKETGEVQLNTRNLILLDDVGSEQAEIKYFGTTITWFKDFIELYYLENRDFSNLIITTNLGGEELEQKYGYRIRSRIREMFNVIEVTGDDKRK